jgi:hypothetical protein
MSRPAAAAAAAAARACDEHETTGSEPFFKTTKTRLNYNVL